MKMNVANMIKNPFFILSPVDRIFFNRPSNTIIRIRRMNAAPPIIPTMIAFLLLEPPACFQP